MTIFRLSNSPASIATLHAIVFAIIANFTMITHSSAEPPSLPATSAGRALAGLIKAVNNGDDQSLSAFIETQFSAEAKRERPLPEIVACLQNVDRRAGKLTWDVIYPQSPYYIGAFAWGENAPYRPQDGVKIFVRLETRTESPNLIYRFEFRPSETPIEPLFPLPLSGVSEKARLQAIRRGAERAAKAGLLSGVVLIRRNGNTLWQAAYGEANRDSRVPNRLSTRFNLASVGKVFTTIAASQLVAEGRLNYDAPVRTYLPDYPQPAVADKITLRHLLTHTSGLGDIFGPGKDDPNRHFRKIEEYLPLFASETLQYEPGHGNAYSNAGLILVSLIIERASGMTFEEYLRRRIFAPSGIAGISYAPVEKIVSDRANGYFPDRDDDPLALSPPLKSNLRFLVGLGVGPPSGAGGGWATADDLARFADNLLNHRLLPARFLDEIIQDKLGFEIGDVNGHKRLGHTGSGPGINASFFVYPDSGYAIIVLTNADPAFGQIFADRIGDVLTRP